MHTLAMDQLEQLNFKVQWNFIRAINDDETELRYRLLAAPLTATNNELLSIAKSVGGNRRWQHQKKTTSNNQCGNCTKHHAPGCANCPLQDSGCIKCGHMGHWKSKCKGGAPSHKQNGKAQHPPKRQKTPWEERTYWHHQDWRIQWPIWWKCYTLCKALTWYG